MAPKPTSSSTTYTTFGVPGGATVWENGAQSGVESRMSRLTTPRNGSDMRTPRLGRLRRASRAGGGRPSPVVGDLVTYDRRRGSVAWPPCHPPAPGVRLGSEGVPGAYCVPGVIGPAADESGPSWP